MGSRLHCIGEILILICDSGFFLFLDIPISKEEPGFKPCDCNQVNTMRISNDSSFFRALLQQKAQHDFDTMMIVSIQSYKLVCTSLAFHAETICNTHQLHHISPFTHTSLHPLLVLGMQVTKSSTRCLQNEDSCAICAYLNLLSDNARLE